MTVDTSLSKITYQADGSTTQWTFPFPAVSPDNIQVFVVDSQGNQIQLPTVSFAVQLNDPIDPNPTSVGGTVTFPLVGGPLGVGEQIIILRVLAAVQDVSLVNQGVLYPTVIEQEFDYLTMLDQQGVEEVSRAFTAAITDPTPAPTPPIAIRKNQWAFFDENGNLTPAQTPDGSVAISAVMQPVVGAATLALARQLMGIDTAPFRVSASIVLTDGNARQLIALSGGTFFSVTVGAMGSYSPVFWCIIFNDDTRGKLINISGRPSFILWPGQYFWVYNGGTDWVTTNPGRWQTKTNQNFFVDAANGNDSNDGLATGNQALKTIQAAVNIVQNQCDGPFTINLANGTHQAGTGIIVNQVMVGANGFSIVGNVSSPQSCTINATGNNNCITVQDNAVLSIKGVQFTSPGNGNALVAQRGGVVMMQNCRFGSFGAGIHMYAVSTGVIYVNGPYSISGGAGNHITIDTSGNMFYQPGTVTITTLVGFSGAFITATSCGCIVNLKGTPNNFVGAGSAIGPQYIIAYNSVVNIGASPAVPGDPGSGIAELGGWFIG